MLANFQDKFAQIIDEEEDGIEGELDLNEKFLSQSMGIPQEEISFLSKVEIRVDTQQHNLQVTGETLNSLEYLKLNDSIIQCFRDIGTSFKNVKVLWLCRCELKELQGI